MMFIRRFNQAWLLNDKLYQPYWGFALSERMKGNSKKSIEYYEKALTLISEDTEKPKLLVNTAKEYSVLKLYEKANSLIDEALKINSNYADAYKFGGYISYYQENYKRAWDMVKRSNDIGAHKFGTSFLEKLTEKMPEP